ncbi:MULTISPECIES: aspartate-semialdehyde dehydrogenase [Pseudomonas]|uniref:Aspartate-semialdehyde dehydrogenase n=1 Tax=Pseudomonas segetis TaxID=298908 RepID=A0A239K059_9PSED|nr:MULTISPECIES: aspartate-semialdehyde dehydrogenase [Pseudomonas]SNT11108.1 Aspartate-semialdehyde dehydrogenase [Pseudomonas segetis]
MTHSLDVAVVGATGSVGEALVQVLEERKLPVGTLHALAGADSVGQTASYKGRNLRVRDVQAFDFSTVQLVFFAAGQSVTAQFIDKARAAGCMVIDLSGGLPPEQAPRVVPEVNPQALEHLGAPYVVTSPSSVSVALGCVLAALRQVVNVERINLTACLAVSSRGREGVSELARQTAELLNGRAFEPQVFGRQMAFNMLAQVDQPDLQGHGLLEKRVAGELKELLVEPKLRMSINCIQAPVFFGDSLSLSLQTTKAVDLAKVCDALQRAPALECVEFEDYPTVVGDAVGQDVIYVGRVRAGLDDPAELNLWIASDNVRKGAAINAVQLAELLIKHYL